MPVVGISIADHGASPRIWRSASIATSSVGLDQENEYANNGIRGEPSSFGGSRARRVGADGSAGGRSPTVATSSVGLAQENEYANNGIPGEPWSFGGSRARRVGGDGPAGAAGGPGMQGGNALHGIVIDSPAMETYDAAMSERTEQTNRPILVVDDDVKIVRLVRMYLERAGYRVIEAMDGRSALSAIALEAPALVVLDVMLPEVDGLAVLRAVRRTDQTPVIILSARGLTDDRIAGLTAGADDYLPKPFSPAELVLRVQRVLARAGAGGVTGTARGVAPADAEPIRLADLIVDRSRHEVRIGDRLVALTAVEFRLLVSLLEADGRVLTRDQLLDAVYGQDESEVLDRTVDVHIGRLRDKLGDDAERPRYVATVRGVGYRAAPPPPAGVEPGDPTPTGSRGPGDAS
jgi:DNA-binding response OmpR family regulator